MDHIFVGDQIAEAVDEIVTLRPVLSRILCRPEIFQAWNLFDEPIAWQINCYGWREPIVCGRLCHVQILQPQGGLANPVSPT